MVSRFSTRSRYPELPPAHFVNDGCSVVLLIVLVRLGAAITTDSGVNRVCCRNGFASQMTERERDCRYRSALLKLFQRGSAGELRGLFVGIMPYISASIMLQCTGCGDSAAWQACTGRWRRQKIMQLKRATRQSGVHCQGYCGRCHFSTRTRTQHDWLPGITDHKAPRGFAGR